MTKRKKFQENNRSQENRFFKENKKFQGKKIFQWNRFFQGNKYFQGKTLSRGNKLFRRERVFAFCAAMLCCAMLANAGLTLFANAALLQDFSSENVLAQALDAGVIAQSAASDASAQQADDLQSQGVVRPEDLEEGLSRKSFQDMGGRRVTLRQPYMQVDSREIERHAPQLLPDSFAFVDPETGEAYTGPGSEVAKIDFVLDGPEDNEIGDAAHPRYPMRGLAETRNGNPKIFSDFEKYMLLRQAWYYRTKINTMLKSGDLASFLKKHPAADGIYGQIDPNAKAVSKTIISDPIYKSPLTTGLYLAPGEVATVEVEGLQDGEVLKLSTHQQDSLGYDGGFGDGFNLADHPEYNGLSSTEKYFKYWDTVLIEEAKRAAQKGEKPNYTQFDFKLQNQWAFQNQKVPCMGSLFELSGNGTYQIGSIYGGPLYLQPTNSVVKIKITGAVETPHFILGVTTKEEFDQHLKNAPGLIATLDVENGQLIGLAQYMKNCDDIEKLAYFWHSVFAINSSLNGRQYNYNVTMAYDIHVPAGEAVALNSSFAAQPYGWFEACMNYETLTTKGNWGTFHELGHIQAKTYGVNWGMCGSNCPQPCEGEVWNNTLILLTYSMLCNMDTRVVKVEHGEYVHPFSSVAASLTLPAVNDYHDYNNTNKAHFAQLSLYSTLIHSFGPEKFIDFFYTYNICKSYCTNARADFVYRIALVDHVNISQWVNENYHANLNASADFSAEQLEFLESLPTFYPIAYEWANGIDGNETARKYDVDGKHKTIFDLSEKSFATYKPFSIVQVANPQHGSIEHKEAEQKAIYTPPSQTTEYDQFDIVVSTEGGRIVTLNVRLRLVYSGAYVEVFKLDANLPTNTAVKTVVANNEGKEPFRTELSSVAGKAAFSSADKEYYHIKFAFKAKTAGLHKFTVRGDDGKVAYFKKNGQYITNGDGGILYSGVNSYVSPDAPQNNFAQAELEVGDVVDIDCHLVNWGGTGYMFVGVILPASNEIVDIPLEYIINSDVTSAELEQTKQFEGWQPKFLDSIKDTSVDYLQDKSTWQVLKFPAYHVGDGQDQTALVDGKTETYFHTSYGANKPALPHEFVIDCKETVAVNYIDILRRGNVNDMLYEVALFGAKDNGQSGIPDESEFFELFDGPTQNPQSTTYRIEFAEQEIRYFKLIVRQNSGQTVIRELSAGRAVNLSQTVKPKNYEKQQQDFVENKSNGKLSTQTQDAFYEFEFLGTGFDVFADTAPEYGSADVYLDESKIGEINLSDKMLFNKCVFRKNGLKLQNHVVKIVATTNKKFNISFINVAYATPVDEDDYPVSTTDFGDGSDLTFSTGWRTTIKNYQSISRIDFLNSAPQGYVDTMLRISKFIHVYEDSDDANRIAFVYTGTILAPSDCSGLFAGCTNLQEINFENFDTKNMLFATSMFNGCGKIEQLDLSNFKTEKLLYLGTLLENCGSLRELDISGFQLSQSAQLTNLLKGCTSLATLHAPEVLNGQMQLPFHFLDMQTNRRCTQATAENAGHLLLVHEVHDNLKHVDHVEATRNTAGIVEHDQCTSCGALLVDGHEVDPQQVVIKARGYGDIIGAGVACGMAVIAGTAVAIVIIRRKKKKF